MLLVDHVTGIRTLVKNLSQFSGSGANGKAVAIECLRDIGTWLPNKTNKYSVNAILQIFCHLRVIQIPILGVADPTHTAFPTELKTSKWHWRLVKITTLEKSSRSL
jgi:hypothetical protein